MVEIGCKKYKDQLKGLTDIVNSKTKTIKEQTQMIGAWRQDYSDLRYNKNLEISLLKIKLTKALESSIKIPDISEFLDEKARYDPWNDPRIMGLQTKIADRYYFIYTAKAWGEILDTCWDSVKEAQDRWIAEVGDCDNWAEAMHYVVANATLRAEPRPKHQSAIAVAWSWEGGHAYNLYVTNDGVYNYEPQNGRPIGKIGETELPYKTEFVLFLS
jgi:hypothetical protein